MRHITPEVSVELEVPFHDVDMLRIAWHGHYYKYFEIARTALFRKYDLDGPRLIAMGYGVVVIESKCRHTSPLRFGDQFRVDAALIDTDYRMQVGFQIHNLTDTKRVAYGHTTLATVTPAGQLLLRTPEAILERLRG